MRWILVLTVLWSSTFSVYALDNSSSENITVHFSVESGKLVYGIRTWIAFDVQDQEGKHLSVWGAICNQKGEQITLFSSWDNGCGSFEITPEDSLYYAEFNYKGKVYQAELPHIHPAGYGLEVDNISQVDDMKYKEVYTPEQKERVWRFAGSWGGTYWSMGEDIGENMGKPTPVWVLQRIDWMNFLSHRFSGKYLPVFEQDRYKNDYDYWQMDEDDIKIRVSRSSELCSDSLYLILIHKGRKIDQQIIWGQRQNIYLRFLLRNLPEGEVHVQLVNLKDQLLINRVINVQHYSRGRNYRQAKAKDIEMLLKASTEEFTVAKPMKAEKKLISVGFYPEGGTLLKDSRSWIAFQAKDEEGNPQDVYGIIRNSKGHTVNYFKTYANGLGRFLFIPDGGKYTVEMNSQGNVFVTELPLASTQGYTMEVDAICHAEDGIYGDQYTAEQRERLWRIFDWLGYEWNESRIKREPVLAVKEQISRLSKPSENILDAIRITVRKRNREEPLMIGLYQHGKLLKTHGFEENRKNMQKLKTWVPFEGLPIGNIEVRLMNSYGKILVNRNIYIGSADNNSYCFSKIHDLEMMIQ